MKTTFTKQCPEQWSGPLLDGSGQPIVSLSPPEVETRPFAVIADKLRPLPVNPFPIPYRMLVASLTPQSPICRNRKISFEAIRPTVYRTPGDFVLFGAGPTPSDPTDQYRAIGVFFHGEIPPTGYWIQFLIGFSYKNITATFLCDYVFKKKEACFYKKTLLGIRHFITLRLTLLFSLKI